VGVVEGDPCVAGVGSLAEIETNEVVKSHHPKKKAEIGESENLEKW